MDSDSNSTPDQLRGAQSVFSPKSQLDELMEKIKEFEISSELNFSNSNNRFKCINKGQLIFNRLSSSGDKRILSDEEVKTLTNHLKTMAMIHNGIRQLESVRNNSDSINKQVEIFREVYNNYDAAVHTCLQSHNLGIRIKESKDETAEMLDALNLDSNELTNQYGIKISFQMLKFCGMLVARAKNGEDNFICIQGDRGIGKSTFAIIMLTTVAWLTGLSWSLDSNMVITDKKNDLGDKLASLAKMQTLQLDEAGNQLGRRQWWDKEQQSLINLLVRIRYRNLTIAICWPQTDRLEKDGVNDSAIVNVSITKRGTAFVKARNKNIYADDKKYDPKAAKTQYTNNQDKAQQIMRDTDMSIITEIPWAKDAIPKELWAEYEKRKDLSLEPITDTKNKDARRTETAKLIMMYFKKGLSAAQISRKLNISRARVSVVLKVDREKKRLTSVNTELDNTILSTNNIKDITNVNVSTNTNFKINGVQHNKE